MLTGQNRTAEAVAAQAEALPVLRRLYAGGDHSVKTCKGLCWALWTEASVRGNQNRFAEAFTATDEALAVLRAVQNTGDASPEATLFLAAQYQTAGWVERLRDWRKAADNFTEALRLYSRLGGTDPANGIPSFEYTVCLKGLMFCRQQNGELARARELCDEQLALHAELFRKNPSWVRVRAELAGTHNALASVLLDQHQLASAIVATDRADEEYTDYLKLDPANEQVRVWALENRNLKAGLLNRLGRSRESLSIRRSVLEEARRHSSSSYSAGLFGYVAGIVAGKCAELRDRAGAEAALVEAQHWNELMTKDDAGKKFISAIAAEAAEAVKVSIDFGLGAPPAQVRAEALASVARVEQLHAPDPVSRQNQLDTMGDPLFFAVLTSLDLRDYAAARSAAEKSITLLRAANWGTREADRNAVIQQNQCFLAEALAGLGQRGEACALVDPLVVNARQRLEAEPDNLFQRWVLAEALINQSAAHAGEPAAIAHHRAEEAKRLMDGLSEDMHETTSVRWTTRRVEALLARTDAARE